MWQERELKANKL